MHIHLQDTKLTEDSTTRCYTYLLLEGFVKLCHPDLVDETEPLT